VVKASVLFRFTSIAVFLQLVLGGLLTFAFIAPLPHMIFGFVVFALALATMVFTWVSKPAFRPLRIMSAALVGLLTLQIVLGLAALGGDPVLGWIHFVNAMAIYGLSVSSSVMSMRWDHMARAETNAAPATG
jgi:heme A synthase